MTVAIGVEGARLDVQDQTKEYFDRNTPEYSVGRYDSIVDLVSARMSPDMSILDIGCATGNILASIRDRTGMERLCGADISPANAEKTRGRGFEAYECDVLDRASLKCLPGPFDMVIVGAVLHHLVGDTRRASRALARDGLANAVSLVADGGYLVIMEPTFKPRFAMTMLFHTKRIVGGMTGGRRVMLGGHWNNIGAPVVSYYSDDEVTRLAREDCGCDIEDVVVREKRVSPIWRLVGVTQRADTIVIARV